MEDKILFITTKNPDYIRNVQEIKLVQEQDPKAVIICSYHKSYAIRLIQVWWQILFVNMKKYDMVWIGFAPQLVLPFFWKFRKKKVVIDFFISFYDTLCYDRKVFFPKSMVGRLIYQWDLAVLKRADCIICDTKAHKEYFLQEFGVKEKEYVTLYLEADKAVYYPKQVKRPKYLEGKYVVLYFGSILPLQGVEIILSAVERIKEECELHFFVIGPLEKKLHIRKPEGENITYINWLPEKQLSDYIAMADLCLAGHFHKSIKKAARTIPGKAYIYQAMEKDMILGDNKANREIFEESEKLVYVPMGDEKALAKAIMAMKNKKDERDRRREEK